MRSFLLVFILSLISCNPNDFNGSSDSELAGKWELSEAFISAGGPQYWVSVEDGEEFSFNKNGTFSSNRFSECNSGFFNIEVNKLFLKYNCVAFDPQAANEDGFITYDIEFGSNYFILTPTSGPICTEGCSYKYQRK